MKLNEPHAQYYSMFDLNVLEDFRLAFQESAISFRFCAKRINPS
jgi:hypothetical protein